MGKRKIVAEKRDLRKEDLKYAAIIFPKSYDQAKNIRMESAASGKGEAGVVAVDGGHIDEEQVNVSEQTSKEKDHKKDLEAMGRKIETFVSVRSVNYGNRRGMGIGR